MLVVVDLFLSLLLASLHGPSVCACVRHRPHSAFCRLSRAARAPGRWTMLLYSSGRRVSTMSTSMCRCRSRSSAFDCL